MRPAGQPVPPDVFGSEHHEPGSSRPKGTLDEIQREAILRALRSANWTVGGANGAAAMLGLKRTTRQARMQRLGIAARRSAAAAGNW
jgi:formate hydrogenlyase transcriptional activator